jgi:hypothetical protein
VEADVDQEMIADKTRRISSYGHVFDRRLDRDGHETMTYLNLHQIITAVTVLKNMTKQIHAVEEVREIAEPPHKGGRPANKAMRHWVVGARRIWTGILKRPFKFDKQGTGYITNAAIFTWKSLQLIDPNASRSQFNTVMRQVINTVDRPGRGRRSDQKSRKLIAPSGDSTTTS